MPSDDLIEIAVGIQRLYRETLSNPFPYDGCRKLLRLCGKGFDTLIPDLDLYFGNIASFAQGAKRLLHWPHSRLLKAEKELSASFFALHPQYSLLKPFITEEYMPDIFLEFTRHEEARMRLLDFIASLTSSRSALS